MKLLKFLFLGFFIISCSNNDAPNNSEESLITELNTSILSSGISQNGQNFTFEYDSNQRLTKKNGGFVSLAASTGYNNIYTKEVHTSFTYLNSTVTIENFSTSPDFTVPKNTKVITLNSSNQIEAKDIPNASNTYHSKKQNFTYSGNKLIKIVTTFPNMPYDVSDPNDYVISYVENFYYDANGNLTKSEYLEQQNGISKGEKIIRTFEDYDSSANPFKKLYLLDEFFYRSLSNNNFRKYTETQYSNDIVGNQTTSSWTFSYDSNGQIKIK